MEAKQTPLIELLERIPQDARLVVEHDQFSSSVHPIGRLCREAAAALRAALSEPTVKESLQVPAEVEATLTTTDIAWLATCRLTKLWKEFGQMRWAGADEGWGLAIEAVRNRINDECQDVLNWKAAADQSQATATELLQKMQEVRNE